MILYPELQSTVLKDIKWIESDTQEMTSSDLELSYDITIVDKNVNCKLDTNRNNKGQDSKSLY